VVHHLLVSVEVDYGMLYQGLISAVCIDQMDLS